MTHPGLDIHTGAHKALLQILEVLAEFVIESGLSAHDFNAIFREALIYAAARRHLASSDRVNISGIAAVTGIPRGEISRILNAPAAGTPKADKPLQSTNKVLAAWHTDPKFTNPNGQPAELKIYGRGASFEALVRLYGGGIPARALLDELVRLSAVDVLPSQRVRAGSTVAVERGMSTPMIKEFAARTAELLTTLLANMRDPEASRFVATTVRMPIDTDMLPLFRKEVAAKGSAFLSDIEDALPESRPRRKGQQPTVNVTVYLHETPAKAEAPTRAAPRRRNFSRRRVEP